MNLPIQNLFALAEDFSESEVFEALLQRPGILLERIVSNGQITPEGQWYNQAWEEWVMILKGEAELSYPDQTPIRLKTGDSLLIPAHQRHRVSYTSSPCIWLALHFGQIVGTALTPA